MVLLIVCMCIAVYAVGCGITCAVYERYSGENPNWLDFSDPDESEFWIMLLWPVMWVIKFFYMFGALAYNLLLKLLPEHEED